MRNGDKTLSVKRTAASVAVFYAVALLLNAPALEQSAENMEYGRAREVCVTLARPFARASRALGLDRVRIVVGHLRHFINKENEP